MLNQKYTHLDLYVSKISWRRLQDMPSRRLQYISSRRLQDISPRHVFKTSSRHVFKTSWRHLQRNNFSSSKTSSRSFARCLQDVFKTSWKMKNCYAEDVFKTSLIHVFKTSSRHIFKTSSRGLQRNNFSSSKTSSRGFARCLQDVFKTSLRRLHKTSSRRLEDVLEDQKLLRWRRVDDVFKTSWRPTNVCWEWIYFNEAFIIATNCCKWK